LNWLLIPRAPPPVRASEVEEEASPAPRGAMAILAFVFAASWYSSKSPVPALRSHQDRRNHG
jgi:hypothetical protein